MSQISKSTVSLLFFFLFLYDSCTIPRATPRCSCSSCTQRFLAMRMRFRWHFSSSMSASIHSRCLQGWNIQMYYTPSALGSHFHSTVRFGSRSLAHRSAWLQHVGVGWLGTTLQSTLYTNADLVLRLRSFQQWSTPCHFRASALRTSLRLYECKPWRKDCVVSNHKLEFPPSDWVLMLPWKSSRFAGR